MLPLSMVQICNWEPGDDSTATSACRDLDEQPFALYLVCRRLPAADIPVTGADRPTSEFGGGRDTQFDGFR